MVSFSLVVLIITITVIIVGKILLIQEDKKHRLLKFEIDLMTKNPFQDRESECEIRSAREFYEKCLMDIEIPKNTSIVNYFNGDAPLINTKHYVWTKEDNIFLYPTSDFLENYDLIEFNKIYLWRLPIQSIKEIKVDEKNRSTVIVFANAYEIERKLIFYYSDFVIFEKLLYERLPKEV